MLTDGILPLQLGLHSWGARMSASPEPQNTALCATDFAGILARESLSTILEERAFMRRES